MSSKGEDAGERVSWVFNISRCSVALAALVFAPHMRAQGYATVYQAKVSVVSKLAGHVVGGIDNVPVVGARVELRSSDWKTVLNGTQTDRDGNFLLDGGSNGRLFYVQISAPGFDPYQLRIRIDSHAKSSVEIHLVVAT